MKTLTLLQPWASLLVMGHKTIETRSWRTSYRGSMLIHARKGKKGSILITEAPFVKYIPDFNRLPFGAIIGQVWLEDVVPVENVLLSDSRLAKLTLEEKAFGDYTAGRWAWLLTEPIQFKHPIQIGGSLNLWEYSGDLPKESSY